MTAVGSVVVRRKAVQSLVNCVAQMVEREVARPEHPTPSAHDLNLEGLESRTVMAARAQEPSEQLKRFHQMPD